MGLISLADKIMGWFTPEKFKSRLRNKVDRLKREKKKLLKAEWTPRRATRMLIINQKLVRLQEKAVND